MKKLLHFIAFQLCFLAPAYAQFGEIRGKVTDKSNGMALPGATVSWTRNGTLTGTTTNDKGEFIIKPLAPGTYNLEFSFVMFKKQPVFSIVVNAEKATYVDVALLPDNELPVIDIVWTPPMIDKGSTSTITTLSAKDIQLSAERDIVSMVAQTAGVYQREEGGSVNIRGSREGNTLYLVDGIKMTGPFSIPKSAIAEISVLTGGIPAEFGDATGGVVIITTKSYKMR